MSVSLKINWIHLVVLFVTTLSLTVSLNGTTWAQSYTNSAHGTSGTGIERFTLGPSGTGFAIGNCIHCHEQHTSVGGIEPAPTSGGPDVYLGFDVEEDLCYGCHGSGSLDPPLRQVRDDIETDASNAAKPFGHDPTIASLFHRANETTVDGINANRHVECTDCHNPHAAKTENDGVVGPRITGSPGGNLIGANSPLLGVSGIEYSTYPAGWLANLTTWSAANPADYTLLNNNPLGEGYATKEYQICFKCHSSFSGNTDGWDLNPGGAGEWTDVALEFNPANNSYHPVVQPLAGDNLNVQQLIGVDITWTPGDTMYCSDCHGSDAAGVAADRYGPHGSATKWLLTGTNQNWPFSSPASNGFSTPQGGDIWAELSTITPANAITFCRNCHPDPLDAVNDGNGSSNSVHTESFHTTNFHLECANCHIRVPHGGAVSRLISTSGLVVGPTGGMPNRYRPSGAAGGPNPIIDVFTQNNNYRGYAFGNNECQSASSGGWHPGPVAGESW